MAVKDVTNDEAGWETVVEPYADTFEFEEIGATLTGIYESSRTIEQADKLTGEIRNVNCYTIVEHETGDKFTVWGSYSIDEAFQGERAIPVGNLVRITWEGKADLEGGRSVNKYRVQTKTV